MLCRSGTLVCFVIVVIFIKYRYRKIIKGSCRELMIPIIFALIVAYLTVFSYIFKPVNISCYINFGCFHLTCTLLFGPLLLKTVRLYRIFRAAEKCQTFIKFVSAPAQIAMLTGILLIQVSHYIFSQICYKNNIF